jgi:hypothetical protein
MKITNPVVLATGDLPHDFYIEKVQSPVVLIPQVPSALRERADFWMSGIIFSDPTEQLEVSPIGLGKANFYTLHAFFPESYWSPERWLDSYRFLGQVIDGLKRRLDYQGVYQAYLLRQMSEEEFQEAAREYAYESREIAPDVIRSGVAILEAHTTAQFSVSELADMFGTDEAHVEKALGDRLALP